jgi:hypothetical protein
MLNKILWCISMPLILFVVGIAWLTMNFLYRGEHESFTECYMQIRRIFLGDHDVV